MTLHGIWHRSVRTLNIYSRLPRDVYVLFIARFVNSLGQFVYPFLTLLLTQRIGLSTARAGTFIFFTSIAFVPGALLGGRLADRFGRKRMLVIMQISGALFLLPGAFLLHSTAVAYLLIVANLFNAAARPASSALVTDRTNPANRQAAFSLLYLGMNAGWAIGPLLAGFMFEKHGSLLFIGDSVTTLLSACLTIIAVKESKPNLEEMKRAGEVNPEERPESGGLTRVLLRRPFLLLFAASMLILNFVYGQSSFTIPIQLARIFGARGPVYFGFIMTVNALSVVLFTAPLIALTRRFRAVRNLLAVAVLYALGFGMLFFAHRFAFFIVSALVWSVGEIVMATNTSVYLANHTPSSHRGRMNGLLPIFWNGGRALNGPIVGSLIESHPISWAWALALLLAMGGGGLLVLMGVVEKRRDQRAPASRT
ncbi:MAG TPA: MFS transporter [Spirochaetia bacterium]|nr:MFS transporter [Spirochaetia bacterium]